ncbi:MAG: ABC transporter ATP-binding protein [Actinomycetota bacterium]|nr:ABC transporter ATP-binding protein [Actinomycetota bacterium]
MKSQRARWHVGVAAVAGAAMAAAGLSAAAQATASQSASAPPQTVGYHTQSLSIPVNVGPDGSTHCTVVGELFVPNDAGAAHQVPSILTTNGFGGSYSDQDALAGFFAARDYEVLTYSGLGFGGSGCNIELDTPAYDGRAASELVSWLGNRPEILTDGPDDPRVGMIGGSYGGAVQLAASSIDRRIDAIVPVITWNDLAYSLGPNNDATNFVHTDNPPGILKDEWTAFFFGEGLTEPLQHATATPFPPSSCPGFDPAVCPELAESAALGYPSPQTVATLRAASMVTYGGSVHAPTLLMQGENDTLFNINEAVANYNQLRANKTPVKLVLQSWGHSGLTPAPGEVDYTDGAKGYETQLIADWFAKYLGHRAVSTGPAVEYYRNWVPTPAGASAKVSYGTATSWPVGTTDALHLSGDGTLTAGAGAVTAGNRSFVNPPGGTGGSYSETSAIGNSVPGLSSIPPSDIAGTVTTFETSPLPRAVDSVGVPTASFTLHSLVPAGATPATDPVLFAKIYDVAPNGTPTLVNRLVSPIRVGDLTRPVSVTLPGVVHRYGAGDRIELVLAATDDAYLGNRAPNVLSVAIDPAHPGTLDLPVVASAAETQGGRSTPAR